jgi:hypothetical protein
LVAKVVGAMRFIKNDKNYALKFMKTSNLDLGADRDHFTKHAHEAAMNGYLFAGTVDDKLRCKVIAVRAAHQATVTDRVRAVLDFAITRKVVESLR